MVPAADDVACEALTTQWDKLWQKLRVIVESPDVSASAELLSMLRVTHEALARFDPLLADAIATRRRKRRLRRLRRQRRSAAASTASSVSSVSSAMVVLEEADVDDLEVGGLRAFGTLDGMVAAGGSLANRGCSRWISERLRDLSTTLRRRWQALVADQEGWVTSQLGPSTDVRQAGVLLPFSKFVSFVEAVEAQTGAYDEMDTQGSGNEGGGGGEEEEDGEGEDSEDSEDGEAADGDGGDGGSAVRGSGAVGLCCLLFLPWAPCVQESRRHRQCDRLEMHSRGCLAVPHRSV